MPSVLGVDQLSPYLAELKSARHCYVAYSGGLDSHVLLHLLTRLLPAEKITAIHINHQLSENAEQWAEHCLSTCKELGVDCRLAAVEINREGKGIEAAAREARYRVFEGLMSEGALLLQAHHADDQVETVLYRLLRGSGAKGLAGIPVRRELGVGKLLRPLLEVSKVSIEQYGREQGLSWITDESNTDERFDRNFIRHRVLPVISERWPDYAKRVIQSSQMTWRSAELDQMLASEDFTLLDERVERQGWSLKLSALTDLPRVRQINVLRYWLIHHGVAMPGSKMLETAFEELLTAKKDAQPNISWSGVQLRRFNHRLYLSPTALALSPENDCTGGFVLGAGNKTVHLPGDSRLEASRCIGKGLRLEEGGYQIRFRQGGERCQPEGRCGSNTLKKLFQEYHLEPWLRHLAPLLYSGETLVAVADLWVCEGFQAKPDEPGIELKWVFPPG